MGFSANKLRVNLKLTINRLKLLEKKKTEIALKSRKEIADYLSQSKDDRARIRVEHIIREDYLVEALELLELYCDLLLARFGLIETMKYCEDGLVEAVSTLIWAAPRLQSDVQELKIISTQLGLKYGKQFLEEAARNTNNTVNEKLINKLSPNAPPKALVEQYLVEIARNYNIPYEPEESLMDELHGSSKGGDDNVNGSSGFGGSTGGSGPTSGIGNNQIGFEHYDNPGNSFPPQMPSVPGSNAGLAYPPPQVNYPPPVNNAPYPPANNPTNNEKINPGPGYPPMNASQPPPSNSTGNIYTPYPPSNAPPTGPSINVNSLPNVPDLPDVPTGSLPGGSSTIGGASGGDDLDFDDLNRRFEELKKKK
ncbi:IST1 homolog [Dendronephthya gigantea]|uniref:IST1 homolog n=1 Tax=Dendronephthya gigantea TaxID=151771 RepID=UPI00106B606B|nr:IST1 homolog [Dendronephthya gigantea]